MDIILLLRFAPLTSSACGKLLGYVHCHEEGVFRALQGCIEARLRVPVIELRPSRPST